MSASLEKIVELRIQLAKKTSSEGSALYASSRMLVIGLLSIGVSIWLIRNTLSPLGKDPGELAVIAQRVNGGDYGIDGCNRKIGVFGNLVSMLRTLREHIDNARCESVLPDFTLCGKGTAFTGPVYFNFDSLSKKA